MSSSLGFSIRQYYQDLLNYYSLYQAPTNHLPLDLESAVYEAPGPESGIYAHTTYQQNLPHYYVVYPYGSNWSPAGGSSLMQDFRYESPSASEAAGSGVYRLTLDRLREALRAPSDQPDDEESPNGSAKPPTNPDDPPASPDEPPVKPENLPMNPSESPTNRQEPASASKESRSPSRIPSQLRTLFSRVGRESSHACQAGKCEADRNAKTAVLGSEIGGNPLAGTPGGVLRYTQPFMDTFPLSRRGLSWPFGYDLARGPVYYPSTHLISPHWQNSPSADVSNPSSPSDNPFSYSSSPSLHSNNPTLHTDNLFSHISNRPSHANKPFSGTDNPSSDTIPSSHANNLSSDTNSPSSHANHNFQHLSNPHFSEPSSRSAPQDFDDDARGSPVDSRSKEELEPRDRESTSGRRPHGSYTPSNEHTGTVQDSLIGNGAGDTTHLTYDSLSPSNHGHQAYRFLTESHVTVLPPHVEAATDNHFPYDLQLGYNMYAIKSGGGPPTNARVLASQFEPQSSVKPNTRDSENNREYRANERAQIVLADPIGYETQVLTGDQARYDTQGEKDQKESGAQGKYQLGEITGSNQPVYGYRWVSDERAELDDEQEYYVSVAEQDAREQAEPDPVMVQEDRRQRNYETLYPFLILHHGQEL
ncbi:uncharacterized protein LOC119583715 isoform X1 [Penaeus monodon]|uniref:uncharacterized protein LOC119583715 isoform X1 n=1 Tax=Penaeus monodon TaxID=6687 RepID=UPI0018A77394|nr:uncharacterized protein LOC119583715 isoform X1 [Penaeus monodon]XP_037788290.1 uncharacterized protein LOC119583715 isoform X1 [Penaeus monodon]